MTPKQAEKNMKVAMILNHALDAKPLPKPTVDSLQHLVLCKELACIAAFNLSEWPKAQNTVYEAIKVISTGAITGKSLGAFLKDKDNIR